MKRAKLPVAEIQRGRLIVFEGLDGSGKSTHIARLQSALKRSGRSVTVVHWCSDGVVGRSIQRMLASGTQLSRHAFSALHAADFADQFLNVILPAMKRGDVVLCDRWFFTEVARDEAMGLDVDWAERLFDWAPEPDLVLYFDLPVDSSLERVNQRVLKAKSARGRQSRRTGVAGTMGIGLETAYQADGEPMTEMIRRRHLREFQTRVAASYMRQSKARHFVQIDSSLAERDVRREVASIVSRTVL